ncbi:FAD/NAD(P)-binding protein [Streptosporangium carneum]|uniref:FAD/NAD(P)-binding protein n=1 Tax=Streptosporangium carneum TaxID=47481 RepID=UPI0022F2DB53|nr:FAD/NAD(P)-binding protein [Streptosporangium carneum]
MSGSSTVAVVGGGASGALTAVHLLRRARTCGTALEVALIDQHGRHATGQAYSTTDPHHLLNARADRMSALEDDPGHLLRWARENGLEATGSDFLPREAYGRYLRHVLETAQAQASPGRRVTRVTGTVRALTQRGHDRPVRVRLADGREIDADAVVLATGNPATAARPPLADGAETRYVADPWAPGALAGIGDGAAVLVMGTGLTMVDIAVTVTRAFPETTVYAVSRRGLLPRRHRCPFPPPVDVPLADGPLRLAGLLRDVRAAVRDNGGDWRGVVDGLRPRVPDLWARLSVDDQRRFLNLAARYWEVHRHRIPPATASRVAELRATGRLRVLRGQVSAAAPGPGGLAVRVGGEDAVGELHVGWLVNGTGPASVTRDPFLARLFADGLARPDPLRLGLDADAGGSVLDASGRPNPRIFTLGPPLRGKRYETTAIPEIRAQAAALAPRLVEVIASGAPAPLERGDGRYPSAASRALLG